MTGATEPVQSQVVGAGLAAQVSQAGRGHGPVGSRGVPEPLCLCFSDADAVVRPAVILVRALSQPCSLGHPVVARLGYVAGWSVAFRGPLVKRRVSVTSQARSRSPWRTLTEGHSEVPGAAATGSHPTAYPEE